MSITRPNFLGEQDADSASTGEDEEDDYDAMYKINFITPVNFYRCPETETVTSEITLPTVALVQETGPRLTLAMDHPVRIQNKALIWFASTVMANFRASRCKRTKDQDRIRKHFAVWKDANKLDSARPASIRTITAANIFMPYAGVILATESLLNYEGERAPDVATCINLNVSHDDDDDTTEELTGMFNDAFYSTFH